MANEWTQWIPVIGTLAGTALGAGATYAVNAFNQGKTTQQAREQRDRERLEEVYRLLIQIEREYISMWGQALKKLTMNVEFESYESEGMPPLLRLEMLVKLYHADDLSSEYEAFENEQNNLGTIYGTIAFGAKTEYSSDEMINIVTTGHERLVGRLRDFQSKISDVIKA